MYTLWYVLQMMKRTTYLVVASASLAADLRVVLNDKSTPRMDLLPSV